MKKLIIEICYHDRAGLLAGINAIKSRNLEPGEFRNVRSSHSVTGFLHTVDVDKVRLINGKICEIRQSKLND